jgi:hypothetical protein
MEKIFRAASLKTLNSPAADHQAAIYKMSAEIICIFTGFYVVCDPIYTPIYRSTIITDHLLA